MIRKTGFYSWKCGNLAQGCQQCVLGQKLVLFVTGLCPQHCFYCPLSEAKKNKDVVYANEWKLKDENDTAAIITEARLTEAKGAGITGGDPLVQTERACRYIRLLKRKFGKKIHVHLYTILPSITLHRLKQLHDAGLDEIRPHPDFNSEKHWHNIGLVAHYSWDIGVEIPAIPGKKKETVRMIGYFKDRIDFLNLNELEISDTNSDAFIKRGFAPKNRTSYGIKGSEQLAKQLMREYCAELPIHYCTTTLKDRVQMAARIKRRAKNVAQLFDRITDEGMLVRGALYPEKFAPGFGYRKKLAQLEDDKRKKSGILRKLKLMKNKLAKRYSIPKGMIAVDVRKPRILTSERVAREIREKGLIGAVVTEYPTWDMTEIEVEFVG